MKPGTANIVFPVMVVVTLMLSWRGCLAANVSYDHRSLIIDGRREIIISAAIHYPRSVPAMWPSLVQTAKEGGCNAIESYVFWNGHETSPGKYYFGGRYDLVNFIKIVQQAGMYMILRIGPVVAAEWNFGGVPVWLHYVPGTVFRTDNEPWKHYMQNFTTYIVNLMKQEKLFAPQGGPIILSQVENEYGYYEGAYGEGGKRYAQWAAAMAVSQNIGVPWMMCQQWDAPPTVISTCNSFYCDQFTPNTPDKPKIWTENWPGWFKTFGARDPHRPAEDVAFSVARFFQKGGSVHNYYMYHGGTNFGRTAGGPFITTSYDYEAPIDEYGLPRFPKWGHLKELHRAIKLSEHVLLTGEHRNILLGPSIEADVYTESSGVCAAFLSNTDNKTDQTVVFRNSSYHLPAWSVSILPDCKNVVFNTAKVTSQTSKVEMLPENLKPSARSTSDDNKSLKWEVFSEKPGIWGKADFVKNELVDHINTTKDTTDYLWYTTRITVKENGRRPVLFIESKGHTLHIFINKEFIGTATGNGTHPTFKYKKSISLKQGKNEIDLLSMTVGLQNAGSFYEWVGAGLTSVRIDGLGNDTLDLSKNSWSYKLGVQGEQLGLSKPGNSGGVKWTMTKKPPKKQPLTWYKVLINPPSGNEPVGLDMLSMGKGMAWLNGEEIGRYWPRKARKNYPHDECVKECDYRGKFMPDKCLTGCGEPSQRWYHVPRSWFKPSGNELVIFEERGGDPTKIKLSKRKVTGVCGDVGEGYPSAEHLSVQEDTKKNTNLSLKCPENTRISAVKFASFGNPTGSCGSYIIGDCHDANTVSVLEKACLGKSECRVGLGEGNFTQGICPSLSKKLAVEATCT